MSGSILTQNIPQPTVAMFDTETGMIVPVWFRFFMSLFARTGGPNPAGTVGTPGGLDTNVQYNSAGVFGGLTNIQLTTRIQPFTTVLKGAVPASGGVAGTFLRNDATFNKVALTSDTTGTLPVANGGTGLTAGTSGGILGYTAAGVLASSGALTNHALVLGAGAGATPTALASLGTTTTVLHGNAAAAPTFGAVSLTADVTGTLPVLNGGTGVTTATGTGAVVRATAPTMAGATVDGSGDFHLTTQTSGAAAAAGTIANAPHAGNPDFWVPMQVNGVDGWVPWWHA